MDDLISQFKDLLFRMSFYNTADRGYFWDEMLLRNRCREKLKSLARVLIENNIDPEQVIKSGAYLIYDEDWIDPGVSQASLMAGRGW